MSIAGKHILIVDDDPEVAGLMRAVLTDGGASVRIAPSVKEGLSALDLEVFNLVLLDYVISEKVAEQFLVKAAALNAGVAIPVIIVSGHGESLTMERFQDFPQVKAVLSKPFDPGILVGLIAKAIA